MATIETRRGAKRNCRVSIRLKDQPPVSRSFTKLTAAKDWARRIETEMRDGALAPGSGRTVSDLIDVFMADQLCADARRPPALVARQTGRTSVSCSRWLGT
jgi:hypothetical protein